MREMQLAENIDLIALPPAEAGRRPFADAVDRQKGRLGKWRREESGGSMRLVMFREDDRTVVIELFADQFLHPDLFLDPNRNRFEERPKTERRAGKVGVQETIKFEKRFLVKGNKIQVANPQASLPKAILYR